jgi:hypothetical protein
MSILIRIKNVCCKCKGKRKKIRSLKKTSSNKRSNVNNTMQKEGNFGPTTTFCYPPTTEGHFREKL